VRKRDKRVLENKKKLEAKTEANKKKTELIRRQNIEARNKELENYQESEWASMAALEDELKQIEQHLDSNEEKKQSKKANKESDEEEEEEEDSLYCIACDKAFKSDKAFANHENSKKHKSNVALLKNELENEFNEVNS
jgi:DnaJ family protein A protein 5